MRRLLLTAILGLATAAARADDIGLVRIAETWRYFKGTQEPPSTWKSNAFDDAMWAPGRSGFSTRGGYGEATIFDDYGATYRTLYFRKRFSVDDPDRVRELILRIDYDDAFVAYLNGREVTRRGLPGDVDTPVAVTAGATNAHARGFTEEIDLSSQIGVLQPGENVLAIQLAGQASLDYTMALVPELLANFTRSPYVQNTTTASTQIAWKTFSPSAGWVEYGTNNEQTVRVAVDFDRTNHLATIVGLQAHTRYFYRVGAQFGDREAWSDWSSFRTFKPSGSFTFSVIGDTGWASRHQYEVADQLQQTDADLIMHLGDLAYYSINQYNSDLRVLSVYAEKMRTTPMFLALGNHDALTSIPIGLDLFHLPTNSVTGTEHYYSFDEGDAHFSVLWSDLAAGSRYDPGSPQYEWLEEDLRRSSKPWKFLFFHHCWRTSTLHLRDDYDFNLIPDTLQLDEIAQLASRHGAQVIFHGHDHAFERFTPRYGVMSFLTGGGGADLYGLLAPDPDSLEFQPRWHFLKITVKGEVTTVQAIDDRGVPFDTTHIARGYPENRTYAATWHRPRIEESPADDQDGNLEGQTFDFAGPPITGKSGRSTGAGRLFVNHDAEHLFLGLDEVMLHPGEEVFLFLQTREPGVTNLLDFGWNLSVANFSPSVVAILGDEFADTPATNSQGARFLRMGLPLVPGQRLQQFNHSPQHRPVPYEQSANYIELALPFSEIGCQPGDAIRVASVVGLANEIVPRPFDEGGIVAAAPINGRIEPLLVQLASAPPEDSDSDGLIDRFEALAGTDPHDPDSALSVAASKLGNGSVVLEWSSTPGRWYRIEQSDGRSFRDLEDAALPVRAIESRTRFTLPAHDGPPRFFRIALLPDEQ